MVINCKARAKWAAWRKNLQNRGQWHIVYMNCNVVFEKVRVIDVVSKTAFGALGFSSPEK